MFKDFASDSVDSCLPACEENFIANRDQALEQFIRSASVISNPNNQVQVNLNDFKKWEKVYLDQENAKKDSQMECHLRSRQTGEPVSLDCLNKNKDKTKRLQVAQQDYRKFLSTVTIANLQSNFLNAGYSQKLFCLIHRYDAYEDVFKINSNSTMLDENKLAAVKEFILKKAGLKSDKKPDLEWLCDAFRSGKPIPRIFEKGVRDNCV
jgi:hypothetical protein